MLNKIRISLTETQDQQTKVILQDLEGDLDRLTTALNKAVTVTSTLTAHSTTDVPSGGTSALLIGTSTGFGLWWGAGAPTAEAGQGSLYLRSDGTGTNDRMY